MGVRRRRPAPPHLRERGRRSASPSTTTSSTPRCAPSVGCSPTPASPAPTPPTLAPRRGAQGHRGAARRVRAAAPCCCATPGTSRTTPARSPPRSSTAPSSVRPARAGSAPRPAPTSPRPLRPSLRRGRQAGQVYELGGDTAFTLASTPPAVRRAEHRVTYRDLSVADYAAALVGAGLPEGYAQVLAGQRRGYQAGRAAGRVRRPLPAHRPPDHVACRSRRCRRRCLSNRCRLPPDVPTFAPHEGTCGDRMVHLPPVPAPSLRLSLRQGPAARK